MEIISAVIDVVDEKYFIKIGTGDKEVRIPLSEDRPNDVKSAFNKIIEMMKSGVFKIELKKTSDDLFSSVADEYLNQLNREMHEVYGEMQRLGLI